MSAEPRRRGPKPNPDRGQNTGYRITGRRRFELQMAQGFVGASNLQEVLDVAVSEFIDRMLEVDGFQEALLKAELSQQNRAKNVRDITPQDDADED